jgi:hypothetical protein
MESCRGRSEQIIPRRLMSWLVLVGLVMAAGTLGVLWWGSDNYGDVVARTMGMTTFALFRLFSSLETMDEEESVFGGSILANRPLLMATGLSVLTIILAVEFGFLQRLLGTVSLTVDQWAICIVVSLSLIVVEEVRKLLKVRTGDEPAAVRRSAAVGMTQAGRHPEQEEGTWRRKTRRPRRPGARRDSDAQPRRCRPSPSRRSARVRARDAPLHGSWRCRNG